MTYEIRLEWAKQGPKRHLKGAQSGKNVLVAAYLTAASCRWKHYQLASKRDYLADASLIMTSQATKKQALSPGPDLIKILVSELLFYVLLCY